MAIRLSQASWNAELFRRTAAAFGSSSTLRLASSPKDASRRGGSFTGSNRQSQPSTAVRFVSFHAATIPSWAGPGLATAVIVWLLSNATRRGPAAFIVMRTPSSSAPA